ncbi:deaminase, partial [Bradyrhizobium sp. NBAIM08]|uniref:deaminase n=1 Tax=Bradyrhizobium sp. NBAIM08 TaxID=2793815 RepID=UPI0034D1D253
LEPCVMCAGALNWAHIGRIVFGAFDEKAGYRRFGGALLHTKTQVTGGILEPPCADLMKAFFRKKRAL